MDDSPVLHEQTMPHSAHPDNSSPATTFGLPLARAGETAIDPVCGMTVDPASAAGSFTHSGTTYHFCSQHCLTKFRADPGKYLHSKSVESCCSHAPTSVPTVPGAKYTCPMHPEIVQD